MYFKSGIGRFWSLFPFPIGLGDAGFEIFFLDRISSAKSTSDHESNFIFCFLNFPPFTS
jgi:hypothetical protein